MFSLSGPRVARAICLLSAELENEADEEGIKRAIVNQLTGDAEIDAAILKQLSVIWALTNGPKMETTISPAVTHTRV